MFFFKLSHNYISWSYRNQNKQAKKRKNKEKVGLSAQTPESKKAKQSEIEDSASPVVKKKTNKGKQTVHGTVKQGPQTGNSSFELDPKASLKKKNSELNTPGGSGKSRKKKFNLKNDSITE